MADSETKTDKKNTKKAKRPTPAWMSDLRYGRSLSVEFFKRNVWLLMVFVVAILSLIRETEMKRLVEEKGLGLEFQEFPPYEIELDRN